MSKIRGLYRFLNRMLPHEGERIVDLGNCKLRVNLADHIGRTIYMGYYEVQNAIYLHKTLKPGDTFVDVGANIGYYSMMASPLVGEKGKVLAFEPFPTTFKNLIHNIELNKFTNIQAVDLACSDVEETREMFQPKLEFCDILTASMTDGYPGETISNNVQTITLDEYCENNEITQIKLLKIDTDGWDGHVLRGAKNLLETKSIENIIVELNLVALAHEIGTKEFLNRQEDHRKMVQDMLVNFGYKQNKIGSLYSSLVYGASADYLFKRAA